MSESIGTSSSMSGSTRNNSLPKLTVTYINTNEESEKYLYPRRDESESERSDTVRDLGWELRDEYLKHRTDNTNTGHVETRMKIDAKLYNVSVFPPRKEGEAGDISFIPLNGQDAIINPERVETELKEVLSGSELGRAVEYICGKPGSSSSEQGRKIFAILSMISKQHSIKNFYEAGIVDGNLPVRRYGVGDSFKLVAKGFSDDQDLESLGCLNGWSYDKKELFFQRQWHLLSPFFGTRFNKPPFYALEDKIILPWTSCSPADKTGGNSDVSKIQIHDAHHGFDKKHNGIFALKVLHSSSKKVFEAEFEALKKTKPHKHLIPVLAGFTHQNRYYMIFPWAEGGNLHGLFSNREEPDHKAPGMDHWVITQCYGLATALKHIHDISMPVDGQLIGNAHDPIHDGSETKIFGRHGDIKPSNVLLFQDESLKPGTLKICDFGLTIFHSEKSKSTDRILAGGKPLTYSAPETTDDVGISRKLDVWCLGCLYLDFLTWLLLGPNGVGEFNEARYNEHGSDKNWFDDQFFKRIQGGQGNSQLIVKQSVKNHILYLESHKDCNEHVKKFLHTINDNMLITNYKERIGSDILGSRLEAILKEYGDETQRSPKRLSNNGPLPPKDTNMIANSLINLGERQNSRRKRHHEDLHKNTPSSSRQRRT